MPLPDDLLASLPVDRGVVGVHIGIHWTTVGLAEGPNGEPARWGMAKTLLPEERPGHRHEHASGSVAKAGTLQTCTAHELAALALSHSGPEQSVGWAAINALNAPDESRCVELNAGDFLLERGQGKRVVVVGHFPFVRQLRPVVGELWVLELNPAPGDTPAGAAPEVVPQADVVAVTSLTLLNGTFGGLAGLWRADATVILLGPSTPFSPLLFDYGIDYLSGTDIVDPERANRTICQGASFKQVQGVRLLTMAQAPASRG